MVVSCVSYSQLTMFYKGGVGLDIPIQFKDYIIIDVGFTIDKALFVPESNVNHLGYTPKVSRQMINLGLPFKINDNWTIAPLIGVSTNLSLIKYLDGRYTRYTNRPDYNIGLMVIFNDNYYVGTSYLELIKIGYSVKLFKNYGNRKEVNNRQK